LQGSIQMDVGAMDELHVGPSSAGGAEICVLKSGL
jgi:hypothetical protein